MKKFALAVFAVLVVGAVVYAEADAEPWESVYKQRDYKKPQRFSREIYTDYPLQSNFMDAGVTRTQTLIVIADAGVGGNFGVVSRTTSGLLTITSDAGIGGGLTVTGKASVTANSGSCTLDGASPSKCTATVTASAVCVCGGKGTTAATAVGVAASVTSTTLTCTAANGLTSDVNFFCDR